MKRSILQEPDERLSQRCEPFKFGSPEDEKILTRLVGDLQDSMGPTDLGLAAPQIGCMVRVIAVRTEALGEVVMVNPSIRTSGPLRPSLEKCLSVSTSQRVVRATKAGVAWRSVDGGHNFHDFKGQDAIVLQHECDHLDGITINRK